MRLDDQLLFSPKISLGLKRILVSLNHDIDKIKNNVEFSCDIESLLHSINPRSPELSQIERIVLTLEDRRFFLHTGFDIKSIPRGLKRLMRARQLGGISTIDQQIVRISTKRTERTLSRKAREILLAIAINAHCSKRQILHYYIHNAYLGHTLQGVEVASDLIFATRALFLNTEQAAFLACLLPLPFPKRALDEYKNSMGYPLQDPFEILSALEDNNTRWVRRMRIRMDIALRNQYFIPKSR